MAPQDTSLEERLAHLSTEIAGAFSIAFFELETIRTTAGEFGNDIGRLLASTATAGEDEPSQNAFEAFLSNASSAAAAAESAAGSLSDRAFQDALIRISGSLLEMKKHTIALSSISSLTKIAQTETHDIAHRLTAFVESLDGRCKELQQATARSSELVVGTQRQSGLARDKLTAIALEFRALSEGTSEETKRLADLARAHHAYMGEIRADANRLDAAVRDAVGGLIGCLQFPDSFAQRSEHVQAAMAALKGASGDERIALSMVISAQLGAMGKALDDVATAANRALKGLTRTFSQSPIIQKRSDAADPSDAWMIATAQANEVMLESLARARDQFGAALGLLKGLKGQIDATDTNLEISVQLNRELETSVHNASVVSYRSGSQNSPVQFLARSVKDVVDRTSDLIRQISDALGHIRGTSEALSASPLERDLHTLLSLQEAAASEAAAQAGTVNLIREIRRDLLAHADRLNGAATAAGNAFDAAVDRATAVTDLARAANAVPPAATVPDCDLGWLYASYTMEEERFIHRSVLGLPVEQSTAADEDLDDFML